MAKWTNDGENAILDVFLKAAAQPSFYLGLYTNPTSEPAEDVTLTDLTEPSGGAYARIQLQNSDWSLSGSVATHTQKTFSASGAAWGNVYGCFICNVSSGTVGKIFSVEQFSDGPYNVPDGGAIKITAKLTCS